MSSEESPPSSSNVSASAELHQKNGFHSNPKAPITKDPSSYPDCCKLSWDEAKLTGISKGQWRKQKRLAEKLEKRPIKRKEEKERRKLQKRQQKDDGTFQPKSQKYTMACSTNKLRVAIDLDFFDYMVLADSKNALTQVGYCYSTNRKNPNPLQLYACGVGEKVQTIAKPIGVFLNWDMHIKSGKIDEVFDKSEIVYLCAESENVLEELEESKVYIIGGLVDHNHHKGLCYGMAKEKGFAHARLPIEENIKLDSRKVLTINHVFDILATYDSTKDWKNALLTVIPERKRKNLNNKEYNNHNAKEPKIENDYETTEIDVHQNVKEIEVGIEEAVD